MPTVMRIGAARVVIFPRDHPPAHVHVLDAGREAVFNLTSPTGPVQLREQHGYTRGETSRLAAALNAAVGRLWTEWMAIHGDR